MGPGLVYWKESWMLPLKVKKNAHLMYEERWREIVVTVKYKNTGRLLWMKLRFPLHGTAILVLIHIHQETEIILAYRNIRKKWTMPVANWAIIWQQPAIKFGDRLDWYNFTLIGRGAPHLLALTDLRPKSLQVRYKA